MKRVNCCLGIYQKNILNLYFLDNYVGFQILLKIRFNVWSVFFIYSWKEMDNKGWQIMGTETWILENELFSKSWKLKGLRIGNGLKLSQIWSYFVFTGLYINDHPDNLFKKSSFLIDWTIVYLVFILCTSCHLSTLWFDIYLFIIIYISVSSF